MKKKGYGYIVDRREKKSEQTFSFTYSSKKEKGTTFQEKWLFVVVLEKHAISRFHFGILWLCMRDPQFEDSPEFF